MSTFNVIGQTKKEYDIKRVPMWLGTVAPLPLGGVLNSDFLKKDMLIPAATPVYLSANTGGEITPLVVFEVVSYTAPASGATDATVVVKSCLGIVPAVNSFLQKLGATFGATAKAGKVTAVAATATAGQYSLTIADTYVEAKTAGDLLVFSSAIAEGSSKSMADQPNGYLYNDICFAGLDPEDTNSSNGGATGSIVQFHGEGVLIDRNPVASLVKAQMKSAVPNVIQIEGV